MYPAAWPGALPSHLSGAQLPPAGQPLLLRRPAAPLPRPAGCPT